MSWAALAIGGTTALIGAGTSYLSSQQQQNAMNGLAGSGYATPDYDAVIDFLGSNWQTPQFQNYNPVSYTEGYEQFLGQNQYTKPMNKMLQGITNMENRQYRQDLDKALPGYRQDLRQLNRTVGNWGEGKLGADLTGEVTRNSTEQAVLGGFGGSQAGRNLTARDLGLTSLDLQQKSAELMPQVLALGERMNPVSASALDYLMTPQQLFGTEVGQQQYANQTYNTNATNAAQFSNQRASMIADLMAQQQGANATGTNTQNMLNYQAASASNPWASGLASFGGSLASMYGQGRIGQTQNPYAGYQQAYYQG